jgi:hypothetical protein
VCADAALQLGAPPLTRVVSVGAQLPGTLEKEDQTSVNPLGASSRVLVVGASRQGRFCVCVPLAVRVSPPARSQPLAAPGGSALSLCSKCFPEAALLWPPFVARLLPKNSLASRRAAHLPLASLSPSIFGGDEEQGSSTLEALCAFAFGGFGLHAREHARGCGGEDDRRDEQTHKWAWVECARVDLARPLLVDMCIHVCTDIRMCVAGEGW